MNEDLEEVDRDLTVLRRRIEERERFLNCALKKVDEEEKKGEGRGCVGWLDCWREHLVRVRAMEKEEREGGLLVKVREMEREKMVPTIHNSERSSSGLGAVETENPPSDTDTSTLSSGPVSA